MLHLLNETSGAALCISAEELRTDYETAAPKVEAMVRSHIAVSAIEKQQIIDQMALRLGRDKLPCWCTVCVLRDPVVTYHEEVALTG